MEYNKETNQWWHKRKCNHWIANHECTCGYDAYQSLRAENARLTAGLARIADDYYAEHDMDAPIALSEMREALMTMLTEEVERR